MSRGRRRDEWDRWGQFLAMFSTAHGDGKKKLGPIDFWPPSIVNAEDRIVLATSIQRSVPTITGKDLIAMMRLE